MALDLFQLFLIGFGVVALYKVFAKRYARAPTRRKSRRFVLTLGWMTTLVMLGIFLFSGATKAISGPHNYSGIPALSWVLIGVSMLIILKIGLDRGPGY